MNFMSDQFLAGAGLAKNQDGGIGGGDEVYLIDDLLQGRALADEITECLGFHDLFLKICVLLFESRFELADFLEGPGIGNGAAGIIRENTDPHAGLIGDINPNKYADCPEHFTFIRDWHGVQTANGSGFEKRNGGEFAGILIQITKNHLLAGIGNLAENSNAKRYAGEWVGLFSFGIGSQVRGGGSGGMEASGLIRAFLTAGTIDADVPLIHEPNSDRNDHGALSDAIHEPFEQQIEFPFLADLQQQITDKSWVKPYIHTWLHRINLGEGGDFSTLKGCIPAQDETSPPSL
jgi:hypothetical protein